MIDVIFALMHKHSNLPIGLYSDIRHARRDLKNPERLHLYKLHMKDALYLMDCRLGEADYRCRAVSPEPEENEYQNHPEYYGSEPKSKPPCWWPFPL